MQALKNKQYFNYGGQGPLPSNSIKAIAVSWQKIQELGPFTNDVWPYITKEILTTKNLISEICGIPPKRISLTENVSSGCIIPLWGLPFSAGDHLLISDCEHPGIVAACKELARRKELKIGVLPVQTLGTGYDKKNDLNKKLLSSLDLHLQRNTKLVVISHVLWNTGQIMPIKLIAKKLNELQTKPYLLVDAAQSFCHIPVKDACDKADIFAFTGHKWACGPEGLGGVALSERVLKESSPTFIGWKSLKAEVGIHIKKKEPFHSDGRRFEIATSCIPLLAGLRNSILMLQKEGTESERLTKIKSLSSKLWNELKQIEEIELISNKPPSTGIVSFIMNINKSPEAIVNTLGKQRLWLRVLEDPKWLRACVHITTNKSELDNLSRAIKNIKMS